MQLTNLSPFAAVVFRQLNADGTLDGVVAVRGGFVVRPDAPMALGDARAALQWSDEYEGDPQTSSLIRPTDLAPFKPGTDVSVLGDSLAPGGAPARQWIAGIRIADRLDRQVRVTGPRQWRPTPSVARVFAGRTAPGWALSEPEPATRVPLCWQLAGGGTLLGLDQSDPASEHPDNPLGAGLLDRNRSKPVAYRAPQIESVDHPAGSSLEQAHPVGFGLIPPWWRLRRRHAGTYDPAWQRDRHPLLPLDFDDRFWQAAHPDMVVSPWLEGDEAFALTNLLADRPRFEGRLPGVRVVVRVHRDRASVEDRALALDGVHFDLRDGRRDCFLTWRVCFPLEDAVHARLVVRDTGMDYRRRPRQGGLSVAG